MAIVYERRGAGSPLVLLHGIGHHWQAWAPVLDGLAARHDVIAIDLPGFGASAGIDRYEMSHVVGRLAEFFTELGVERPHVAGNSLGGALALELAAAGHVASATALDPAGFWSRLEFGYTAGVLVGYRMLSFAPRALIRRTLRTARLRRISSALFYGRPGQLDPEVLFSDMMALRSGRAFTRVARAGIGYQFTGSPASPVTVAWGTKDRILRPRQADRARERLPEARHVWLPGCGHLPMYDDPELVTRTILETTGAVTRT
ncbi:alpha/beta fold hydrolase [Longispora albida]|uniref:alpha/beta fold hydrolase n=1 Tax=Longispora albida TaxID=203523 RepID=UPI00036F4A86|nr:alpha/beta hydrolase [Longispora albida]